MSQAKYPVLLCAIVPNEEFSCRVLLELRLEAPQGAFSFVHCLALLEVFLECLLMLRFLLVRRSAALESS